MNAAGNLPRQWQGRERFVVLDTRFDHGAAFLAAWRAWRDDPHRCTRLIVIAVEPHLPTLDDLLHAQRTFEPSELAAELRGAWPPLTHNLHRLSFDRGRVELLLAPGDLRTWLPQLVATVDAFRLDAQVLDARSCKALGRLAAPGATLVAPGSSPLLREHLRTAGFEVAPESDEACERSLMTARFAPAFMPRRASARASPGAFGGASAGRFVGTSVGASALLPASSRVDRNALVLGAGLAGCAAAWALAEQGWRSTVFERNPRIADEASGNPGGLFHGTLHAHDGLHARFNRAAALAAHGAVKHAVERGVSGNANGLLRLETAVDLQAMQALLQRLGLPPEYVQALCAGEASMQAGIELPWPCWFYPQGGWVSPAGLAGSFLERAGSRVELRCSIDVDRLERCDTGWRVLDARGVPIAEASTVVLANAARASRLIDAPGWPIDHVRGQISIVDAARIDAPRLPIAGSGYVLPAIDGRVMFGATAHRDDADASVRDTDHALNLAQLARLLNRDVDLAPADLEGRTAWRCSATDRLPLIGAVPDATASGPRLDQPRFVPRLPGLYVFAALGSRGITWSALGAQVLASTITGSPAPVEASLLDAVDPARFVSRQVRRGRRE